MSQPPLRKQKPCREPNIRVRRPVVIFLCIAALGVAACDPAKKPPTLQASPEVAVAASSVPGVEPQSQQGAEAAAVVEEQAVASERILNLAYTPAPGDEVIAGDHRQAVDEKNMLPDMFDQQKKASNISLSGGLLTDPEKDEYLDSVNGAEVSLKVRTR